MEQDFHTPEQVQPRAWLEVDGRPVVWEACQTLNGSWGYDRDNLDWKSPQLLVQMLVDGVSKGGNLLLNVGPTARGEFDPRARETGRHRGVDAPPRTQHLRLHPGPGGAAPAPGRALHLQPSSGASTCTSSPGRSSTCTWTDWPDIVQLLHDGSEVRIAAPGGAPWAGAGALTLELPIQRPEVLLPVVELFLEG